MPENLETLQKSRGAHRGVATKLYNEADGGMNKPFTLLNEDDLIRLKQIVEILKKNQAFLSEQNQKIPSFLMIPTTWTMKLLRQRSMMTRYAKTLTMFIGLFSERQDTCHKRARLQPEASRFREKCRISICRSSTCPVFPETTCTGSRHSIASREQ